jgi:predicted ATP-grasp superfamily ATP-dependent carboligase
MEHRVLITDGQERSMLAVSRSLRGAGYAVSATAHGHPAATLWSRSCSKRFAVADPLHECERFVRCLEEILESADHAALIPGSDASLLAASRARDRLEQRTRIGLPAHAVIERSLDKLGLAEESAKADISSPRTVVCSGQAEAQSAAESLGFPVLVKPMQTVFSSDQSMRQQSSEVARDGRTLERMLERFGEPLLIQERVPGPVYSCAGVATPDRGFLAFATSRYSRTWPPEGGNVAFSETIEAPSGLRERVESLIEGIGWQGIFELELLRRQDGTFSAIDLNPRAYGSLTLADRAGAPLPVIWCEWLLDGNPASVVARPGVRYRWEDADARHFIWQLRHRHFKSALAVLRPRRRVVHAYFRLLDPGPLLARLIYMFRRRMWRRRAGSEGAAVKPSPPLPPKSDHSQSRIRV